MTAAVPYDQQAPSEAATAALTMRLYDQLLHSEDAREGPPAFAEQRQPQWQGR
jgi:enoyl-CoA hydratase/carnithine racemase